MADLDPVGPGPVASEEYLGQPGRTRQSTIHYSCMSCGFLFTSHVHVAVNLRSDPELGERLRQGELNVLACPSCGAVASPSVPVVYHDPASRRFFLVVPDALRHQELELRIALLKELAADEAHVPEYVRAAEVVFGPAGLRRALLADPELARGQEVDAGRREALDRREEELVAREEDLAARQEDIIRAQAQLERDRRELEQSQAALERDREALRALALDLESRERALRARRATPPPPPPPPAGPAPPVAAPPARPEAEIDAWRASEARVGQLLYQGQVYLLARASPEQLPVLEQAEPTVFLQQRSVSGGPLVCLGVLVGDEGREKEGRAAPPALFWPLDPSRPAHRDCLVRLGEEFHLRLELFDEEARLRKQWELRAPLEENVRWVLARCPAEAGTDHDFEAACKAFDELGEERLGRKQHNFSADSFQDLASPAAARLALGIVAYWSQPENQDYLIGVKSFPLVYWRAIRERVVRRALEFGLRLSPELAEVALELKLAESREGLLRAQLASFAEVALRMKPSDLEPAQDWDNWRQLLADCVQAGVQVDKEIEELAAASARRAGQVDETAAGGDLGLLPLEALLPLLQQREQRRDAALELCERRAAEAIEALFNATCAMTRSEVARVMPAMVNLGEPAVPYLIQGLKHRKSFVRQGCALALGAMKAASAVEPLVEMLLSEPTTVWKEAARALGELGPHCQGALLAATRQADAEVRERLAWGMAQASLTSDGRSEIEAMARGADERLARVAARALTMVEEVRQADQEVRGKRPLTEQTIVRSFSRQFFEGISPPIDELGESDILEQEEVLDDRDILDEEVEVEDADILDR